MKENFNRIDKEIINRVNKKTNIVKRYIEKENIRTNIEGEEILLLTYDEEIIEYHIKGKEILTLKYEEGARRWCIRLNDLINNRTHLFASNEMLFTEESFITKVYDLIMNEVKQHENKTKEQIKESKEEIKELINLFVKIPYDESGYTQTLRNYLFAEFEKEENKINELEIQGE